MAERCSGPTASNDATVPRSETAHRSPMAARPRGGEPRRLPGAWTRSPRAYRPSATEEPPLEPRWVPDQSGFTETLWWATGPVRSPQGRGGDEPTSNPTAKPAPQAKWTRGIAAAMRTPADQSLRMPLMAATTTTDP